MTGAPADRRAEPDSDLSPLGCLALLWPAVPEGLLPMAERSWLEQAAAALPAIPRLGLELPLGEEEGSADLHQFVSRSEADASILRRYLLRTEEGPLGGAALRRFLAEWADRSDLCEDSDGLYLEWDRPGGSSPIAAPAIFLPVEGHRDPPAKRRAARRQALARAERLQPPDQALPPDCLDALFDVLPPRASVNYLGFMTGRGGALRVNLRSLERGGLAAFLEALAWPGDREAAATHFDRLIDLADRVVVALDFAPRLLPSIGFEIVMDAPPGAEMRWNGLFDHLSGLGLCSPAKRRALEAFDSNLYPEAPDQPWPASWLLAALASPPQFVPWVERRISHLKLAIAPDGTLKAKAYVSAQHFWSRAETPSTRAMHADRRSLQATLARPAPRPSTSLSPTAGRTACGVTFVCSAERPTNG